MVTPSVVRLFILDLTIIMKFTSLLLCSVSCVLLQSVPAHGAPAPTIAQTTVDASATPADRSRSCQQAANAVVTLYSGTEIGAGSIVAGDGTILTAHHVVKEAVSNPSKVKIYVKLADGQRHIGRAIASDTRNDLALVQIPVQTALSTVPLASTKLQPGQAVCAIGSPSGRTGVLSRGAFTTVMANGDLQSAVRLTYGNSGGPLLNAQGDLVGVNKAIWVSNRGENTGVSYATSVQTAQTFIAKHLRPTAGTVTKQPAPTPSIVSLPVTVPAPIGTSQAKNGQAGVSQASVGAVSKLGVNVDAQMLIQQVESGSPAALGGLQPGDRLVAVNGTELTGLTQLQAFLNRQPSTAVLTIRHKQQTANVQVYF
ncbi:trypsin-like peptidase domain-containing protein [Phormidium sp. FACHB-592]|uniref:S1C family serine protease n=1 Tax=Stenomitos frigidus AS-A4 TaxID=2933935 RepID=A0ABV0KRA6_9CYAN|nr:trypsin-like peptidase domain-containing protein [Phormidium sp. FACHB-592]MBD2076750.1 trypsin-like peptidase domain-containing protein [Phormidium sp. FACHB-592]